MVGSVMSCTVMTLAVILAVYTLVWVRKYHDWKRG